VQLRGFSRSGTEYQCINPDGPYFDSPYANGERIDSPRMIRAMKSWDPNVVRVPFNEDCWLGINVPAAHSGAPYRRIMQQYVSALRRAHLYVIVDMHVSAPANVISSDIDRMADADHAPDFWRSVASTFKNDHGLLFDVYNEPNHIDWNCWLNGCTVPSYDDGYGAQPTYQAAGMQTLIDAIRSTGATQPLLVSGINYANSLARWLELEPSDPLHQLVASEHNYGPHFSPCQGACLSQVANVARHVPVVFAEMGENDCRHAYIDRMMAWSDRRGIGYLGWAWDAVAKGGWNCKQSPALITNYDGTPTGYGIGFRDHFRALARRGR
jgi:hypothetical protein